MMAPFLTYNLALVLAAVIPSVYLLVKVYRSDRLEPESPHILWVQFRSGILSALIALVSERIFSQVLYAYVDSSSLLYRVLLYFVVVAVSEEGAKHFMLRKSSWNSPEFNCLYDGIIYAVFVSLGFATWENISYVTHYGFGTALIRSFTAIPGHASFGVFMGVFYSAARLSSRYGDNSKAKTYQFLSVLVPVLIHGTYDYIATAEGGTVYFFVFIAILFITSSKVINSISKSDRYI